MSKVKIINLKHIFETESNGKYTSCSDSTIAVIEGPNGVIITNDKGQQDDAQDIQSTIMIYGKLNNGITKSTPEGYAEESIEELLRLSPALEMNLDEYVNTMSTDDEMYENLLASIEEIGLNPNDYKRN